MTKPDRNPRTQSRLKIQVFFKLRWAELIYKIYFYIPANLFPPIPQLRHSATTHDWYRYTSIGIGMYIRVVSVLVMV